MDWCPAGNFQVAGGGLELQSILLDIFNEGVVVRVRIQTGSKKLSKSLEQNKV